MEEKNEIHNVAIIGNGMLGTQIAMIANYRGYNVFLYDPIPNTFQTTMEKYRNDFTNKGIMPSIPFDHWEKIKNSCQIFDSIEKAVNDADLVVEAVPEILEMKIKIFETMGKKSPPTPFSPPTVPPCPFRAWKNTVETRKGASISIFIRSYPE